MAASNPRTNPTRQDTFKVTLMVDGLGYGIWDKKTGGELDSDELKYHPGGMAPVISLGGKKLPGNITLQREYDGDNDGSNVAVLFPKVGSARATVKQNTLDFDGNSYGKQIVWKGILKKVSVPDVDSEGNAAALMEIEISVDQTPVSS